tara:strand:- start:27 stop:614 length:588 start_codon:yes stop_codon:yes gene_type:complete
MVKFNTDVDIDFADRDDILKLIKHTSAMQDNEQGIRRHNSGVYVTDIPYNPLTDTASIDFKTAEERGYFKIDFLNVNVYKLIKDQAHYDELLAKETPWHRLKDKTFFEQVIHIGNHYDLVGNLELDTIPRMSMFLALIRPGKRHLVGKTWADISKDIWTQTDEQYFFKKSHSVSYAVLVALHIKLLDENLPTREQ